MSDSISPPISSPPNRVSPALPAAARNVSASIALARDAYQLAVAGVGVPPFVGTRAEWMESLRGPAGVLAVTAPLHLDVLTKTLSITLGSAASRDVQDFASAAQGLLAGTALQPADTSTGGNGAEDAGKVAKFDASGNLKSGTAAANLTIGTSLLYQAGIHTGTVVFPELTGVRSWTLPDKSGTFAVLTDIAAQVQTDWNATSGLAKLLNKPELGSLAFQTANIGDYATKTYVDNAVTGLWDARGSFDASINTWPVTGGSGPSGAILKGDLWLLGQAATAGPLLGYPVGCIIWAVSDNPGQTAANWGINEAGLGYVAENVANKTQDVEADKASTVKFPSMKAIYDWIVGKFATITGEQTLTNKTLTSPTLTSPALGTPASGDLRNCAFPVLNQDTTGTAAHVSGFTRADGKSLTLQNTLTLSGTDGSTLNVGDGGTLQSAAYQAASAFAASSLKINGHQLNADVTITATDTGALPKASAVALSVALG